VLTFVGHDYFLLIFRQLLFPAQLTVHLCLFTKRENETPLDMWF